MKTKHVVFGLESLKRRSLIDSNSQEIANFVIKKWTSEPLIKDEKYGSMRCPSCNAVINYKTGHFCVECGQKLVLHW